MVRWFDLVHIWKKITTTTTNKPEIKYSEISYKIVMIIMMMNSKKKEKRETEYIVELEYQKKTTLDKKKSKKMWESIIEN